MSPRTQIQFEEIRQEKRKHILEVSLKLFANGGFHGTSISKIAKEASISKGLLYNYFKSKDELLKEIIKNASSKIEPYSDPNKDGVLVYEEFFFFLKRILRILKENVDYLRLYSILLLQSKVHDLTKCEIKDVSDYYAEMLYKFFIRSGCEDPEGELLLFAALLKGIFFQYITNPELFSLELFENKLVVFYEKRFKTFGHKP